MLNVMVHKQTTSLKNNSTFQDTFTEMKTRANFDTQVSY